MKLEGLTNSELIGIFDSLFSCVVSWLEGHSPVQTIFTCLYLHNTAAIRDKTLMGFCNGILKLTGVIKKFIIWLVLFYFFSSNFCNKFSF